MLRRLPGTKSEIGRSQGGPFVPAAAPGHWAPARRAWSSGSRTSKSSRDVGQRAEENHRHCDDDAHQRDQKRASSRIPFRCAGASRPRRRPPAAGTAPRAAHVVPEVTKLHAGTPAAAGSTAALGSWTTRAVTMPYIPSWPPPTSAAVGGNPRRDVGAAAASGPSGEPALVGSRSRAGERVESMGRSFFKLARQTTCRPAPLGWATCRSQGP